MHNVLPSPTAQPQPPKTPHIRKQSIGICSVFWYVLNSFLIFFDAPTPVHVFFEIILACAAHTGIFFPVGVTVCMAYFLIIPGGLG